MTTATSARSSVIPEVTQVELPVLRSSVKAVLEAIASSNPSWAMVGQLILKDPGLTLYILRKIIGSTRNSMRSDMVSLRQACMLLGVDQLQGLIRTLPCLEDQLDKNARQGFIRGVNRAFHAASHARDWAMFKRDLYAEEIYVAALLHDVAKLALWATVSEHMQQLEDLIDQGTSIDDAQYVILGDSTEHFARAMAYHWNLPPLIHEALRPESSSNPRVKGVVLAVQLARASERGWNHPEVLRIYELVADYLGLPLGETIARIHMKAAEAARESLDYGVPHPAALLPLLPDPEELARAEQRQPGSVELIVSEPAGSMVCLMPQRDKYEAITRELRTGMQGMEINDIMRRVMHGIHDGVGMNRVVFYVLNRDRTKLEPRYMMGTDNDPGFNLYSMPLASPHLFKRLLDKPQAVWINDENREKYWPLVPREFRELIRTNAFYARSVHIGDKPMGLIYADRHFEHCELDSRSYTLFRDLCQLAATGLVVRQP